MEGNVWYLKFILPRAFVLNLNIFSCRTSTLLFACFSQRPCCKPRPCFPWFGTNATVAFLGPMKYQRASVKLSLRSVESIRKAGPWETGLFYLHWDTYLEITPPSILGKTGMFCGTQQDLRDSVVTQSFMAEWRQMKGPLFGSYSGFIRIKNNCRDGYEAYFVLWSVAMSAVEGGVDYHTQRLAGGLLDIWTGGKKWGWSNWCNKGSCYVRRKKSPHDMQLLVP